jgi:hypothetical protein
MSPTLPTWRVIHSQQEMARKNARQALLLIQQRRREQEESDRVLPLRVPAQRTLSTRASSQTGSSDS